MATPVTVTIPHKLGKAEARSRVDAGLGSFKQQLAGLGVGQFAHGWQGDRLGFNARALGQTITGRIDVNDADIRIEVELPAFLAGFADKVTGALQKQGTLLIEKK